MTIDQLHALELGEQSTDRADGDVDPLGVFSLLWPC